MLKRIKELASDSFFYGISKFLGQLVSFLLVPLYTFYLLPEDYGRITILGIYTIVLGTVANLGFDSAVYNYLGIHGSAKENVLDTSYIFTIICSSLFSIFSFVFSSNLAGGMLKDSSLYYLVDISTCIALFDSLTTIPLAVLRLDRKVKIVALSSFLNVFFSIGATFVMVVWLKWGVVGVLAGNATGSLIRLVYLFRFAAIPKIASFNKEILRDLFKFSIYLFPNKLFALAMPYYSQFVISRELDFSALGLYSVAQKFCTPFSLVVSIFLQSWSPYKFQIFRKEEEPKSFFSRFFLLYTSGSVFLYCLISLFGDDILKLMTQSEYHSAAPYVKFLALVPLMQGFYSMISTGVEFSKTQKWRPVITFLGLATVMLLTRILIESFGVVGGALSICCGWAIMSICNFCYAKHLYPINYNWSVFSLLVVCCSVPYFVEPFQNYFLDIAALILVSAFFLSLLIRFRIVSKVLLDFPRVLLFLRSK